MQCSREDARVGRIVADDWSNARRRMSERHQRRIAVPKTCGYLLRNFCPTPIFNLVKALRLL